MVNLFEGELAIKIVKGSKFKDYFKRTLRYYAWVDNRSSYALTYHHLLMSYVPGHYEKNVKQYLKVKYTLRGKQEVLKYLPVGAYPIIYKNQNETWIAINEGDKFFAVVITNLGEDVDKKIPSKIFNLAFLIVSSNNVEYWEAEPVNNRDFPVYVRCDNKNCFWMPPQVLKIIIDFFYRANKNEELLQDLTTEYEIDKIAQIKFEIIKRLNSEDYINEIMSTLEKLENESQEYKLFNEEAKKYHLFILGRKRGYLTEARKKTRVYFKFEKIEDIEELPEGIYLLVFRDMRATGGYSTRGYFVKDEGNDWKIFKLETGLWIIPTVLFDLFYLVKYKDYTFYFMTELPNERFYLYLLCGSVEPCHWMPPVVFNAIWPVVRKHIRKIMRDVLKIYVKEEEEETSNQHIFQVDIKERVKKQLEESLMKGVITTFCRWPKYISESYLLPNIHEDQFSYNWTMGHVHIFPKPTFLPKQIHIYKPEEMRNIPEGVYPIIRYYPEDMQIVFAISPNTEAILHHSNSVYAKPIRAYGLDLITIWDGSIQRYNIADFNVKWNKQKHIPTYWNGVYNGLSMFYLPEVIFRHLMGEKIEPKQEPFVSEIIANIQFRKGRYYQWLESIIAKYKNIPINYDNMKTITFADLHKMPGAWYVLKYEKNIDENYDTDAIVIINMRETNKVFKVLIPRRVLKEIVHWKLVFITVWPDGTIGWWDLITL